MKYFSVLQIYKCLQPMNLIKYKYIMQPHHYSTYLLLILVVNKSDVGKN